MTRTSLNDAHWASLMLVMQQIPRAWKRDQAALRHFVEAALWICRTGAPWRDLPDALGHWPSVYHRWRRWCVRGWWEMIFEALRPSLPPEPASRRAAAPPQHHLQGAPRGERCGAQHGCR